MMAPCYNQKLSFLRLLPGTGWLLDLQPLCLHFSQEAGRRGNGQKGQLLASFKRALHEVTWPEFIHMATCSY